MASLELSEHINCKECFIYKERDRNIYVFSRRWLLITVEKESLQFLLYNTQPKRTCASAKQSQFWGKAN